MKNEIIKEERLLLDDIKRLIESCKQKALVKINTELVLLYWSVCTRLSKHVLGNKRAGYGKEIVKKLSHKLVESFGKGWNDKTLWHCLRCAETIKLDTYKNYCIS